VKEKELLAFGEFRFDPVNQCIWRGTSNLGLTPKAFTVFDYLLANRSRLVTKEELLENIWPDSYVTDAVLKVCIRAIRKALDDGAGTPRFIQTFHRRGYRFIAPVQTASAPTASVLYSVGVAEEPTTSVLVGRAADDAQLQKWLNAALDGSRQIVFVIGEPGVGKSALAEAFLQRVPNGIRTARGHCIEQYGAGEAYMPVLEAFTGLSRNDHEGTLLHVLKNHAPTWLAQMPGLAAKVGNDTLQREVLGATRERMLREMADAIEALTSEVPLVLLFEDLQWCDHSTLDLISYLGRRSSSARLLIVATYRPVDVILSRHPLKTVHRELQLHGLCRDLRLEYLTENDVWEFLQRRFSPNNFDPALSAKIHTRTEGNPLFLVTVCDFLKSDGSIAEHEHSWTLTVPLETIEIEVPENLRELIRRQIEGLSSDEQSLLLAASVVGMKFSTQGAAGASGQDHAHTEEICENLARRGLFFKKIGVAELPDETIGSYYAFVHSLYQNVCYELVPIGKRVQLHKRVGEEAEVAYAARSPEIAAELATHFERGRDYIRAAIHLFRAAENATRRHAYREALEYLNRARHLIRSLPETQRVDLEVTVLEFLGLTFRSMGNIAKAAELFDEMITAAGEYGRAEAVVNGLLYKASALSWLDRDQCLKTSDEAFKLSRNLSRELLRVHTEGYCAYWHLLFIGWRSEDEMALSRAVESSQRFGHLTFLSLTKGRQSFFQLLRSDYREAIRTADEGLALAIEVGDAFDHSLCQFYKAWALLHSGQWGEMRGLLDDAIQFAERNDKRHWKTLFELELAWLYLHRGSFTDARVLCDRGIAAAKESGHELTRLMATILLGHTWLGLEDAEQASNCFEEIADWTSRTRVLMDWIWEMPLRLGLAELGIKRKDYTSARQNAERLLDAAAPSGEKTYMALAHVVLGESHLVRKEMADAQRHIRKASEIVESADLPLAAWRAHGAAAALFEAQNKKKPAEESRRRGQAIRDRLLERGSLVQSRNNARS